MTWAREYIGDFLGLRVRVDLPGIELPGSFPDQTL
jgi:hypothetical protein